MPPKINSRHEFTNAFDDIITGKRILSSRVPFRFQDRSDNIRHTAGSGETLFTIAGKLFKGMIDRPAGFWWIIADYQPEPIIDPTLKIPDGTVLVAPSERTIQEEIFNPKRRDLF